MNYKLVRLGAWPTRSAKEKMKNDLAEEYSVTKWLKEKKEIDPTSRLTGIGLMFLGIIFVFWGLSKANESRIDELIVQREAFLLVEEIKGSEIITDDIRKRATTVERLSSQSDFDDSLMIGGFSAIFGFILLSTGSRKLRQNQPAQVNPCNPPENPRTT
ncbi:hypothetical protein SH580_21805 [Coraliomargarita algicola]|uniref:Uncharacterized protein n=1 Tax=Coraliomargarita algicola TaxID=3092156 RepID=A0ABZ0RLD2_9BACT|nr:hypothetical protein [Coraliomargarita sp. J2-16]WPJ96054.1 hypothetical protein SH580_21805 [Coraliomargarita sp. J2-16]